MASVQAHMLTDRCSVRYLATFEINHVSISVAGSGRRMEVRLFLYQRYIPADNLINRNTNDCRSPVMQHHQSMCLTFEGPLRGL